MGNDEENFGGQEQTEEQLAALRAAETKRIEEALRYFLQKFPPANGYSNAVHFLTTQEIDDILNQHEVYVSSKTLMEWLNKQGYKKDTVEMQLRWLVAEAK